ncbi:antibiotic biosynthesis monooxygenase [Pseudomonas japonica]|uniref:antibiotic biosynthesis monooxygenase n=1 Tax=Pseudomonas japonica TaxID=256466 RepID=UPI0035C0AD43
MDNILGRLTLLPGCIDYILYRPGDGNFHWAIYGVWRTEEARACHYVSRDLQRLFHYLLQRNASLICCDQGAKISVVRRQGHLTCR